MRFDQHHGDKPAHVEALRAKVPRKLSEIDVTGYLCQSGLPGADVLFHGKVLVRELRDLMAAVAGVLLGVLKTHEASNTQRPTRTAMALATVQAAMDRQETSDQPPQRLTTLSDVKSVLLSVSGIGAKPSGDLDVQNAYALLPLHLLNLLKPRTREQHRLAQRALAVVRTARQFREAAPGGQPATSK